MTGGMTSRTKGLFALACVTLLLGLTPVARGAVVAGTFTGTVTESYWYIVEDNFAVPREPGPVAVGSTIEATFTYDPASAVDTDADPSIGACADVTGTIEVSELGYAAPGPLDIRVENGGTGDWLRLIFDALGTDAVIDAVFDATRLPGDGLPVSLSVDAFEPTVSSIHVSESAIGREDGELAGYYVAFNLTSLTVVPEPASLALLGLGGVALLKRRRG